VVVVILGIIGYYNLDSLFGESLTSQEMRKAKIMFIILIFNVAVTIPGGSFTAVCLAYEKFIFPKVTSIIKYLSRSVILVVLLIFGGDAVSIVVLDTAINLLFIVVNAIYVFKKLNVTFKVYSFNISLVKEIFTYSVWIFIFALFNKFQWQSGQLILGMLKDTTTVAIYAVGIMLGTYYGAFASAISSLLLPKATKMLYDGSSIKDINKMMIKIGRITIFMLFFILGAFILFGQQFVFLWLGDNYADSWLVALLIMIVITIPLSQSFANSILEASKKLKVKVLTAFFSMIIGVFLGVVLAKSYDSFGMIIGVLFGRVLYEIILNVYYIKIVKLNMIKFIKEVFINNVIYFIIVLFLGVIINKIVGVGWLNFVLKSILYTLIYIGVFYKFVMLNGEKVMIKNFILMNKNKIEINEN
jgi:O-antigen/teichoic acid export membrane protein